METLHSSTYFELLGIGTTATKEDVQRAFMSKALVWHPDKATSEEQREEFSKVYEKMQDAYRILSNDKARKQYIDAQAATFNDLARASRDVGYNVSAEYSDSATGKFDVDAFNAAFNKGRDANERQKLETLQTVVPAVDNPLSTAELMARIAQRDQDTTAIHGGVQNCFTQAGLSWDVNTFNRVFDEMHKRQPCTELEPYSGNPMASKGLEEVGGLTGEMSFGGVDIGDLVRGGATNIATANIDIRPFHTGELYKSEKPLTFAEMQKQIEHVATDRQMLLGLKDTDFINEPSEIEQAYSELFRPADGADEPELLETRQL